MTLSNLACYLIYSSVVMVYGIGLNRAVVISRSPSHLILSAIKILITVTCTSVLSYLLVTFLLLPADLAELYPFVAVLIYTTLSVFIEAIIRITAKVSTSEFGISILFVFLALAESCSLAECVLNSCAFVLIFFIYVPVFMCVGKCIEVFHPKREFENTCLIFMSIAVIIFLLSIWNVTWLNAGGEF